MLSTIVTKLGDGLLDDEMPNDISFPIKNLAEMTAFEEKLQDVGVQKLIVSLKKICPTFLSHLFIAGCDI